MMLPSSHLALLRRTAKKSAEDGVTDLASSIAFYAFFGTFPLILAVIAIAGSVLESAEAQEAVYKLVEEAMPGSAELVQKNVSAVVRARSSFGIAAVIGLLWSASAGFGAICRAINKAIGASPRHSVFKAKARYFLMAIATSVLLVASVTLTSVVEIVAPDTIWSEWLGLAADTVTRLKMWGTSLLLVFVVFLLLYRFAPTVETRWKDIWPGAVLAALITEVSKVGFVLYVNHVAHLEAVFGSLSSIMVLLLWLYVAAIALVVGAEYNVVRLEMRRESESRTA